MCHKHWRVKKTGGPLRPGKRLGCRDLDLRQACSQRQALVRSHRKARWDPLDCHVLRYLASVEGQNHL
uniref:Uncharacterized protein n=1 Tax=Anguilla anguilla TaxID=7936 RepID=A0A0E9SQ49_ANGAN